MCCFAKDRITEVIRHSDGRKIRIMYADSKAALENILKWLEQTDDAEWEHQVEVAEACRSDMERMARPDYRRGHGSAFQGPQHDPNAPKLNKAIPHVRAMLTAMQKRDRVAALEHGKLALAVM